MIVDFVKQCLQTLNSIDDVFYLGSRNLDCTTKHISVSLHQYTENLDFQYCLLHAKWNEEISLEKTLRRIDEYVSLIQNLQNLDCDAKFDAEKKILIIHCYNYYRGDQ